MDATFILAENSVAYVLERGGKYARIKKVDGITNKTKWHESDNILYSSMCKGGFERLRTPKKYKEKIEKSRKSVGRMDEDKKIRGVKKEGLSLMIENLGLENFEKDLVTNRVVKKSSQNSLECALTIDLEKAGKKHIPKGAERFSYKTPSEYGIIHIPVNRLERVYQTEEATDNKKVTKIVRAIKEDKVMDPIEIGYNYDVQDGHHRWEASIKAGYTHVPCKVVGKDINKVREAKRQYRKLWKSMDVKLADSLEDRLRELVLYNRTDEDEAIQAYAEIVNLLEDRRIKDTILETMGDELDHYRNLSQVLRLMEGDSEALDEDKLLKSEENLVIDIKPSINTSLDLVIDLSKSKDDKVGPKDGKLDKTKLVQMRIPVRGKGGKIFYRMQWINPNAKIPEGAQPVKDNKTSYAHSKKGISDMERRQSNRFPVIHYPAGDLKNTEFNYSTDRNAFNRALRDYYDGKEMPVVKITPRGEILDNHHLVDLAKEIGVSHIPTIVVGNPRLKKELEDRMKDKVIMEDESGETEVLTGRAKKENKNVSKESLANVEEFKNITKKKYPKKYIMEQAKKQGVGWNEYTKAGDKLPEESNILWMRAHQAIVSHIETGKKFLIEDDKKVSRDFMEKQGKDGVEKHFLEVVKKFNYDKDAILEHARKTGVSWKEKKDPDMNWMYGTMAIKNHMRAGKMFAGVRTRQKELIREQNIVVTDQMRKKVTELGKDYGKQSVMEHANTLGLSWVTENKKGTPYPAESRILWMNAHQAITRYIAEGNQFHMPGEDSMGLESTTHENPHNLTKFQLQAMDVGRRNTQMVEKDTKLWAMQAMIADKGIDEELAEELYGVFVENARKAKIKIQFNPFEILPSGVNLIDQIIADGEWKNDYAYERGYDYEHKGANEDYMFTDEYSWTPDEERPVYGIIDLFNQGQEITTFGDVSIVLKDSVKGRTTGSHLTAEGIPYGKEGTTVRSMEDPHQLMIDRWREKWKKPGRRDAQRDRAMNAVIEGTAYRDDINHFETHIHGGVDLSKDVEYISVPVDWKSNKEYSKHIQKIQELSEITGTSIKYE